MWEHLDLAVGVEEAHDEVAARGQDTVELGQDRGQFRRSEMDEGEPGEQAADGLGRCVEGAERVDAERDVGVAGAGVGDEFGDEVDAGGREAGRVQYLGEMAGAAAEIEDGALGEVAQDEGGVFGVDVGRRAEQLDVELVDRAVGGADGGVGHRIDGSGCLRTPGPGRREGEPFSQVVDERELTMPIKPLRRVARTLLATTFVAGGVNGLMNPKPRFAAASALADQGREHLPDALAAKVPEDPSRVVQINSVAQIAGGLLLLSGRAPRPAAFVLAATVVPGTVTEQDFWAETDPDRKAAKRVGFLKDLGLLGGLLIAAADTEGKPSLGWRGRRAVHSLVDRSPSLAEQARDEGTVLLEAAKSRGAQLAEVVKERGPQLGEAVRERGAQVAEVAKERGPQLSEAVRERGAHLADIARDRGPELGEAVRERGSHLAEVAKERGPELGEAVRERGSRLAEVAKERGPELGEAVRERGSRLADIARDRGPELGDAVRDRSSHLAAVAKDRGPRVGDATRETSARLAELARENGLARDHGPTVRDRGAHFVESALDRGAHLAESARDHLSDAARETRRDARRRR